MGRGPAIAVLGHRRIRLGRHLGHEVGILGVRNHRAPPRFRPGRDPSRRPLALSPAPNRGWPDAEQRSGLTSSRPGVDGPKQAFTEVDRIGLHAHLAYDPLILSAIRSRSIWLR